MSEDSELLRLYTETGSENAFTTLVQRYLPLVHSAALRQTGGNFHQTQEVAQNVFALLARKSVELQRHPALVGWLYTATHHMAAKARRTDQRRRHREHSAQVMHNENEEQSSLVVTDWAELRPVVDEVMLQLKNDDRIAVLLRFFENRSHREIGDRLGLSESAARMRVDRALDVLRAALARRGVISTAAALGTALTSQAVMIPPAGLAATISAGAIATASVSGGVLFLFMNSTLFKTVLLTAVVGASTTGFFWQHQQAKTLRAENCQLRDQLEATKVKPTRGVTTSSGTQAEVSTLLAEINTLRNSPANSWQERAGQLRKLTEGAPDLNIPEIQLATEEDWLDATKGPTDTVDDYFRALAKLRNVVIARFAGYVSKALGQFVKQTGGQFPTDPAQLESYLERSLGPAVWQRYEIQAATATPSLTMGGDWAITQKAPIDEEHDVKFVIGPYGWGGTDYHGLATQKVLAPVMASYRAANPGSQMPSNDELLPYATTTEQRATLQKQKERARRNELSFR